MTETNPQNHEEARTVIIRQEVVKKTNGIGTAGFVLSLVAILVGWIPIVGWILGGIIWLLGFVFSLVGIFKAPRGLAIAGLIISLVDIFLLLLAVVGLAGFCLLGDVSL